MKRKVKKCAALAPTLPNPALASALREPFGLVFLERDRATTEVWLPAGAPPLTVPAGTVLEQLTRHGQTVVPESEGGRLWWHALLYLAERDLPRRRPEIPVPPSVAAWLRFDPPSVRYRKIAAEAKRQYLAASAPALAEATNKKIRARRRRKAALDLYDIYKRVYRGPWIVELYERVNDPNHHAFIDRQQLQQWRKQGLPIPPQELPREWSFFKDLEPFDAALAELWWLIQHDVHARLCPVCYAWFVPQGARWWRQGYCADHRSNKARQQMKRLRAKAKRETQAKAKTVKEGRRGKAARAR
jgi:hypothetical protein